MKDVLVVPAVLQFVGRSGDQIEAELLQPVQHFTKLALGLGRIPLLVVNQAFPVVLVLFTEETVNLGIQIRRIVQMKRQCWILILNNCIMNE